MIYIKFMAVLFFWLAVCAMVYEFLYRRYRNADKSHAYEQRTIVRNSPPACIDLKISHIKATTEKRIVGDNADQFRERI